MLLADHAQSRVVLTESEPLPPLSVNADVLLLTENSHFCVLDGVADVEVCVDVHAVPALRTTRSKSATNPGALLIQPVAVETYARALPRDATCFRPIAETPVLQHNVC